MTEYNKHFLRCLPEDLPDLIAMGELLGALARRPDGTIYAPGGTWDPIGAIPVPTGETVQTEIGPMPVMVPRKDAQGRELWHGTLSTPVNLRKVAQALAAERPEIAAGLANLGKFFVVDEAGNAVAPANPYRVFQE